MKSDSDRNGPQLAIKPDTGLPTFDSEALIKEVDERTLQLDLADLLEHDNYQMNPKNYDQFWLDIYPRLEPHDCDPETMFKDWKASPRDQVTFLYLHIPFCAVRCDYCYFYITTDQRKKREYLSLLKTEMTNYLEHLGSSTAVGDLYFGGGTASVLAERDLHDLFQTIYTHIDPSVIGQRTLELHPGTMSKGLAKLAADGLINRASMGVQSFNEDILKAIHRVPNPVARIREIAIEFCEQGIEKINLDFIAGLFRQTTETVMEDLASLDGLIREGLVNSVSVYPRSFNKNSQFIDEEELDSKALLEKFRIQLLFRAYFRSIGWKEDPLYLFSSPKLGTYVPSALADEAYSAQCLGFGNSARSYFDGCNYLNINEYEGYMATLRSHPGATGMYHRVTDRELIRRNLLFGIKAGYVDLSFPVALSDSQTRELAAVHGHLENEGLIRLESNKAIITEKGYLFITYINRKYDGLFRTHPNENVA